MLGTSPENEDALQLLGMVKLIEAALKGIEVSVDGGCVNALPQVTFYAMAIKKQLPSIKAYFEGKGSPFDHDGPTSSDPFG